MRQLVNIIIALAVIAIAVGNYVVLKSSELTLAQQITICLVSYFVFFVGLAIYFRIRDSQSGKQE